MIRTAVRALTLNVYHGELPFYTFKFLYSFPHSQCFGSILIFNVVTVGDEAVNKFVASDPHADYFSNLVKFFREQCINLDKLVTASK